MYDFEELHAANDRFWAALAARLRLKVGRSVPDTLTRTADLRNVWLDRRLLLGQTCGYPLMTELKRSVRVVLTPIYNAPGCKGAWHRSAIVVNAENPATDLAAVRGTRCALNGWDSNSGMNLFRATIAPVAQGKNFFGSVEVSGGHRESLRRVAAGEADIAAIDCVSLAHLGRIEPEIVARTRILCWSPLSPALPLITASATDDVTLEALRVSLAEVLAEPGSAEFRRSLLLAGFEKLPYETYEVILRLETEAAAAGYPRLA